MNYVKALLEKVSSCPYITSYTFRSICQHALMFPNDTEYVMKMGNGIVPELVDEGDKIYVVGECLDMFFDSVAPRIENPFILISGRSDLKVDNRRIQQLPDNLIKWFAVNNITDDPRIQTIPLGIDNIHWRYNNNPQGNVEFFEEVNKEDIEVDSDILVSFQTHTNKTERLECLDYFKNQNFSTYRHYTNEDRRSKDFLKDYYREVRKHKFNVCPVGTGYDCHRIWQTLILNSFPIVKKHKSMEEFYDLPIWFVDKWSEVTKENIDNKYKEMVDKYNNSVYNMDKLWFKYWRDLINACVPVNN